MAGFGSAAAILQIGIRTDATRAAQEIRRFETQLKNTRMTAQQAAAAQNRANASYKQAATYMGITEKQARKLAQANKTLGKETTTTGNRLRDLGKSAALAASAYVGIGAAKEAVNTTTDLAKSTRVLNRSLGLSVQFASAFSAQAQARGVDVKSLGMAFNTLAGQVRQARSGTATAIKNFQDLGISLKELRRDSPDEIFFKITDGLKNLGAGFDRAALARAMFGRGATRLNSLIRGGSDELKKQLAVAQEMGATFSGKSLKSIDDLIAAQRRARLASIGMQLAFTENVQPALTKAMITFGNVTNALRKMSPAVRDLILAVGLLALAFVSPVAAIAGAVILIIAEWGRIKKAFKDGLKFVKDHAVLLGVALAPFTMGISLLVLAVYKNWDRIKGAFESGVKFIGKVWGGLKDVLAAPFEWLASKVRWFMQQIVNVVNFVLPGTPLHMPGGGGGTVHAPAKINAPKMQPVVPGPKGQLHGKPSKRMGGFAGIVPGSGSGDKVGLQAMVEPGEGLFVMNRNAMGALQAMNSAVPRFIGGGDLPGVKIAKGIAGLATGGAHWPDPSSLGWASGLGSLIISKAKDFIASHQPFTIGAHGITPEQAKRMGVTTGLQPGIAGILSAVLSRGFGLTVSSALRPGDTGSFHSAGRAVDLSGSPSAMYRAAGWIGKHLGPQLTEGIHNPNLSWDTGRRVSPSFWGPQTWAAHTSHIHLAKQKGGLVGGNWNKNQLTTLAASVGMRNPALMAAIAMAESAGNPNARGSSGEYGLWQIMPSWGGGSSLLNPLKNARKAKHILGVQGLGAWTTYTSGAYRRFLGGKVKPGLMARLRGGTTGKTAAGMKTPPALGAAMGFAGGDVDAMNTRIGAINDLRAARNLLALQGYQVGAAQNPILGLASPAYPSLAPMLPGAMESSSMSASNVSAGPRAKWGFHTHVYIDGKEVRHVTKKQLKRTARGGRRRLPSAGGG